jgi:hypothetical protein
MNKWQNQTLEFLTTLHQSLKVSFLRRKYHSRKTGLLRSVPNKLEGTLLMTLEKNTQHLLWKKALRRYTALGAGQRRKRKE